MEDFDGKLKERIETKDDPVPLPEGILEWNRLSVDEDDPEFNMIISDDSIPESDIKYGDQQHSAAVEPQDSQPDHYVNMELSLPRGRDGEPEFAVVKRRAKDGEGDLIGKPSNNPLTDTRVYEVQYLDGTVEAATANIIAEKLVIPS